MLFDPGVWVDQRTERTPRGDGELLVEIREELAELASYGYRRACALVNRQRGTGAPRVTPSALSRDGWQRLASAEGAETSSLQQAARRCRCRHDQQHALMLDGFEIKCDSGQTVTTTFAKDCCDREILAFRAWEGKGLPGEPVREMLIEAVEKRFGTVDSVPAGHVLEFLSDNGGAYIAHDTRRIARSLGLTPINTPICSPQSNGMAESFVNTFRRDYQSRMDLSDAPTVLAQLAAAFEHFNEVHPHSSLKMRSPREFRRHRVEQMRHAQLNKAALHCE